MEAKEALGPRGERYALVRKDRAGCEAGLETIRRYLPANYEAHETALGDVLIHGEDSHGWTMDAYVIPRLGSGLIWAEEISWKAAAEVLILVA